MTTTPLDEVDDRILLRRHVAGDREAFGEVYRRGRDLGVTAEGVGPTEGRHEASWTASAASSRSPQTPTATAHMRSRWRR
ncbi:hypothetical protein B277_16134 [Janibacter hoylei PVAS-1]|uniref:Uncharacterized protein n=1 Tax=Janibacter hoylei PVAS-1 TaxID=1210046 RepID=K1DTY4_9MICO|nr:hypothetical protein B277_16134 [Janibacter hoylei PVAS-1]